MIEDYKKILQAQLWNIANTLRGKMNADEFRDYILGLQKILINIQLSTMGTDSEEDFDNLFEDMDLNSSKLGKTPEARNAIIAKVLTHLDKIDFKLETHGHVETHGRASLPIVTDSPIISELISIKRNPPIRLPKSISSLKGSPLIERISKW